MLTTATSMPTTFTLAEESARLRDVVNVVGRERELSLAPPQRSAHGASGDGDPRAPSETKRVAAREGSPTGVRVMGLARESPEKLPILTLRLVSPGDLTQPCQLVAVGLA
jgi:hypothetical protein